MNNVLSRGSVFVLATGVMAGGLAYANEFSGCIETQADRWMYPFNATPGTRPGGSVFGYLPYPAETSFDNRDGQMIVAFDTTGLVPAGEGAENYEIDQLQLQMTLKGELSSPIDLTVDEWNTYLPATAKDWEPDEDAGRPIELYAAGFRYDYTRVNWQEDDPFSDQGAFGTNHRSVFSAGIAEDGQLFEVSSNFNDGYTSQPLAIGSFADYAEGDIAPEGAVAIFNIDLSAPEVRGWVGESLNEGRIVFAVTSLVPASQGDGVLTQFYLKENPLVEAGVRDAGVLCLGGRISEGCSIPADFDGDCDVDGGDLGLLLSLWGTCPAPCAADLNNDGFVNGADLGQMLSSWGSSGG